MLRPIHNTLDSRSQAIKKMIPIKNGIHRTVQEFIAHQYPTMASGLVVEYNEHEKTLSISTPSRLLAQELVLSTKDIRACLAAHRLCVRLILIR